MESGNTSRYLRYAVGEIVLVVVGILIALAVNNWNEEARDRRSAEDLLKRIHRDVLQDTVNFRKTIAESNELREDIKALFVDLYDGVESVGEVRAMSAVYDRAVDAVFSPSDNTYRTMVSSGTLRLISNPELKEAIVDLYAQYDEKRELLAGINEWMLGVIIALDQNTDFIKFNDDVLDIYTTAEMLNASDFAFLNDREDPRFKLVVRAISATAFNQKVRNGVYTELIGLCEALLNKIDAELG